LKKETNVLDLNTRRKPRKAPAASKGPFVSGAGGGSAAQGNLALQTAVKPKPRPTPSRWFSEAHSFLGFRLWDVVYIFAIARQCDLNTEDALGWGMRYWAGGLNAEQDLAIIDLLTPGAEVSDSAGARRRALDEGFVAAIRQGAAQLLGEEYDDEIPVAEAARLQWILEGLYAREGWRLPAMPYALQLRLRKVKERPDGF
jgi:hypothetical protein